MNSNMLKYIQIALVNKYKRHWMVTVYCTLWEDIAHYGVLFWVQGHECFWKRRFFLVFIFAWWQKLEEAMTGVPWVLRNVYCIFAALGGGEGQPIVFSAALMALWRCSCCTTNTVCPSPHSRRNSGKRLGADFGELIWGFAENTVSAASSSAALCCWPSRSGQRPGTWTLVPSPHSGWVAGCQLYLS